MVMRDDSYARGHGFESWHRIWNGQDIFAHLFVVKIVLLV